jgi:hypothetical protein
MRKLVLVAALIAIGGCPAVSNAGEASLKQEALTPHYRLVLQIGPTEATYTAAEARMHHPASGEIMLGGRMTDEMAGMGHGSNGKPDPDRRHVELHVYSRATGKIVVEAHVTIAVAGADKKPLSVPIARMYGIDEGPDDMHYGNNVVLRPGTYSVRAAVNGERARFTVSLPE